MMRIRPIRNDADYSTFKICVHLRHLRSKAIPGRIKCHQKAHSDVPVQNLPWHSPSTFLLSARISCKTRALLSATPPDAPRRSFWKTTSLGQNIRWRQKILAANRSVENVWHSCKRTDALQFEYFPTTKLTVISDASDKSKRKLLRFGLQNRLDRDGTTDQISKFGNDADWVRCLYLGFCIWLHIEAFSVA